MAIFVCEERLRELLIDLVAKFDDEYVCSSAPWPDPYVHEQVEETIRECKKYEKKT